MLKIDIRHLYSGLTILTFAAATAVSGCSMHEPGHPNLKRAQYQEERVNQRVSAGEMDETAARAIGDHYRRSGSGPVELTVLYDPQSKTNTAMTASAEAARIVSNLRGQGIDHVDSQILPVLNQGDEAEVMISYTAYAALAPDCETMPGYDSNELDINQSYKFGCTVETVLSKQIARPRDMAGQEAQGITDGRRSSNIIEAYRTGQQNEPLEGEQASQ